jgi:tetratricopeptide (TPR) repeat protein
VVAIDPENLNARKEIAGLNLILKNYDAAFSFYTTLPESAHDALSLENFSLLSESLGNYPAYHRSLLIRYHRLHQPTTNDFLELARSFELVNQPDGAITTLSEGLRRLPQSRVIRTHLAQSWRNRGNYDEAIKLLAVPSLKTDLLAMSLFIEVCCLKEDYQQALAFLGRGVEKKFGFPPDVLLDLGHIYFNNGYMTEAEALYSSVPDEPSLWPLIANARYRRGDFAGAEIYQKRYLDSARVADPQGWLLMGDILRARGREPEAQQAYQKSLLLMERKLEPLASLPDAPPSTTASNL